MKFRKSTFEIDICGSERPKKHLVLQSDLWTFQKIKNYWNPSTELGERFSQTLSLSRGGVPTERLIGLLEILLKPQMATHVFSRGSVDGSSTSVESFQDFLRMVIDFL